MAESSDFSIFVTIFYYCISILILPVFSFFFSKIIVFDAIIGSSNTTSNVCSAVISIIILHVAVGLFIFRAYSDPDRSRIDKKDDKID